MTSMSSCSFSYIMSCHVQAAVGKDITKTDLVPAFQSLLKDCEAEVSGRTDSFYYCAVPDYALVKLFLFARIVFVRCELLPPTR